MIYSLYLSWSPSFVGWNYQSKLSAIPSASSFHSDFGECMTSSNGKIWNLNVFTKKEISFIVFTCCICYLYVFTWYICYFYVFSCLICYYYVIYTFIYIILYYYYYTFMRLLCDASVVHASGSGQLQANPHVAGPWLPPGSPPEWR